ncbi:MAG: multidrug efflux pump subunit AcrA (membrane-fusion protein) [Planctomycetota bacterium]|jgi:multidrug efflux pump subunit AcrA (membrane-fusion protein)
MKIRIQLILIAVAIVAAVFGMRLFEKFAPETPAKEVVVHVPDVAVRNARAELRTLFVETHGVVASPVRLSLTPEIAGRVVTLNPAFEEGALLEAGTELLRIDVTDFELMRDQAAAGLASAEANVAAAQAGRAAQEALLDAERVSAEVAIADWREFNEGAPPALVSHEPQIAAALAQIQSAEAQIQVAEAQIGVAMVALRQAEVALGRTRITMPFSGRVITRAVEVGQRVDGMSMLATIERAGELEVRLSVTLDDLAYMDLDLDGRGADKLAIELEAEVGGRTRRWSARGARTAADLDARNPVLTLIAKIEGSIPAGEALPVPGLFVSARVRGLSDVSVISIPRACIQPDGSVLVVDDEDRLRRRSIEVLKLTDDEALLSTAAANGLKSSERVVLTPPPIVVEGMPVGILASDATPDSGLKQ